MSKAERRKRARQRARERERAVTDPSLTSADSGQGGVAALSVATQFAEPEPAVHQAAVPTESEFITGPVVPKVPGPVRTARPEAAAAVAAAARPVAAAPAAGDDLEAGDEDDEDDDDGEEDEEGEAGEDEELDEQDALFNLACAAVEEGDKLTWNEVVTWVLAAEVDDPRLALLASMLATEEDSTQLPKLSGALVLEKLELIGLEDVVKEARETVAAAPKDADETEEERALVRTTARELQKQAKRELSADGSKPVRASDVRAAKAGRAER